MATAIRLRHRDSNLVKTGYYGFSWTTLFFGFFPALFRGDFVTFIGAFAVIVILGIMTSGFGAFLAMIAWAFFYNKHYTRRLLERGYVFDGTDQAAAEARRRLGVAG